MENRKNNLTLDTAAKRILDNPDIIAVLLTVIFPEEFSSIPLKEIIDNYIQRSTSNKNQIDKKSEEVAPDQGKNTRYDLHFEVKLPSSGKIALVEIEIQRTNSGDIRIRSMVYVSKLLTNQYHKNYQDYNPVASAFINFEPLKNDRNTIQMGKLTFYNLKLDGNHYKMELDNELPEDLIRIVLINVGGPDYPNFNGVVKFLYDLFHDKREEVEKYFLERGVNNFDYRKVQGEIMEYITLDEQVRHEAEQKGLKRGIKQGKKEGIEEGILLGEKRRSEKIYQKLIKSGMNEKEAYKLAFDN